MRIKNRKYNIEGMSLHAYCKINNVSSARVYVLIKQGLSIKQAIEKAKTKRTKNSKHYIDGVTLMDYCIHSGITYNTILYYIKKFKITAEQAVKNIDYYKSQVKEKKKKDKMSLNNNNIKKDKSKPLNRGYIETQQSIDNLYLFIEHVEKDSEPYRNALASIRQLKQKLERMKK